MVRGVLSKRQRDRKRIREIEHEVFEGRTKDWMDFVKGANTDPIVEQQKDRNQANAILDTWNRYSQGKNRNG